MTEKVINSIIRNRRSVYPKSYTGGEVSKETILDLLENANWAPNHKRTEPWRFIVFRNEGRKKLAEFQSELYKANAISKGNFDETKYEKQKTTPLLASCVIAIVVKRSKEDLLPEVEEIAAVACAMENIYLSLGSFGLGGYFSTGGGTYSHEVKEFLGIGKEDRLLGYFYIGTYDGEAEDKKRKPVSEKITWIED